MNASSLRGLVDCPICFEMPLDKIYICVNSHRICSGCFHRLVPLKTTKTRVCPQGQCKYLEPEPARNRELESIVEKLGKPCQFADRGCAVTRLTVAALSCHESACRLRPVSCYGCKESVQFNALLAHLQSKNYHVELPDKRPFVLPHGAKVSTAPHIPLGTFAQYAPYTSIHHVSAAAAAEHAAAAATWTLSTRSKIWCMPWKHADLLFVRFLQLKGEFWYAWVYVLAGADVAAKWRAELHLVGRVVGGGCEAKHTAPVVPIDVATSDVRSAWNCLIMRDAQVRSLLIDVDNSFAGKFSIKCKVTHVG